MQRVPLGKARFAIRVAKGKTRLIDLYLRTNKVNLAIVVAREILRHCEAAAGYLDKVLGSDEPTGNGKRDRSPQLQNEEQS